MGTCENAVPEKEEDINVFEGSIIPTGQQSGQARTSTSVYRRYLIKRRCNFKLKEIWPYIQKGIGPVPLYVPKDEIRNISLKQRGNGEAQIFHPRHAESILCSQ